MLNCSQTFRKNSCPLLFTELENCAVQALNSRISPNCLLHNLEKKGPQQNTYLSSLICGFIKLRRKQLTFWKKWIPKQKEPCFRNSKGGKTMAWTAYIQSILLLIHISNSDSYQVFQCRKVHTHKMRPTMGLKPLQSRIKMFVLIL